MRRVVEPEWLDDLPAQDPRAVRSRADLRRINRLMRHPSLLLKTLDAWIGKRASPHGGLPIRLLELGAGDGSLLLQIAQQRAYDWPVVHLQLLDLQPVVSQETLDAYRALGWTVEVVQCDVFDWCHQVDTEVRPIVVANLFLHHFEGDRLDLLLRGIAARARAFVCLEPKRSRMALIGSHLLGLIGCNDVTRHDAVISVRAGFTDQELSACWPTDEKWSLDETGAGLFSHRLQAVRERS
ncbi:MAG: hypothetical protein ABIQ97_03795 [Lysobacteraceae bacterium]